MRRMNIPKEEIDHFTDQILEETIDHIRNLYETILNNKDKCAEDIYKYGQKSN